MSMIHLRRANLILALSTLAALAGVPASPSNRQSAKQDEESYVQITSVSVEPSKIHKVERPNEATVTVQVMVHGKVPSNATARIDLGVYSTKPPGNKVFFPKDQETVALDKELIAVVFTVQTTPETVAGTVVVAATIHEVRGVGRIKEAETYKDWRAEFTTAVP
ncbi:MAG TPA: hypothetical protein VLW54_14385 [Candidatus Acidoferrales bacterium]|nr:hypothetical protein [Candidatus Acidoferrales bacterium]